MRQFSTRIIQLDGDAEHLIVDLGPYPTPREAGEAAVAWFKKTYSYVKNVQKIKTSEFEDNIGFVDIIETGERLRVEMHVST